MKKILSFILFALLLLLLEGQSIIRANSFYTPIVSGIDVDSASWHVDYKTVYYAIPVDDRPGIDTADLQNTLVASLDTLDYWTTNGKSVWDRKDLLYVLAQKTTSGAKINWDNPGTFDLTDGDTIAFEQYKGYTNDGNDYMPTGFQPANHVVNASLDSISLGLYIITSGINTGTAFGCLVTAGADTRLSLSPRLGGMTVGYLNTVNQSPADNAASQGFSLATRRADRDVELYHNGTSLGGETDASTRLPELEMYLLARNNDSTADLFFLGQIALVILLDKVSDEEAAAINTIIETYMDAIGAGVQ